MEYKKEYINFETPMLRSDLCGYSDVYTYIYIYIYIYERKNNHCRH